MVSNITLRSGIKLSLFPVDGFAEPLPTTFRLKVIPASSSGTICLENETGVNAHVDASLIRDNHMSLDNNCIELSLSQYRHWFKEYFSVLDGSHEALNKQELALFEEHFNQIVQHKDLIYSRSDYFLTRFSQEGLPLGALLEAWEQGELVFPCHCGGDCYAISGSGSLQSGLNSYTGYCQRCQSFQKNSAPSFGLIYKVQREIKQRYDLNCYFKRSTIVGILRLIMDHKS